MDMFWRDADTEAARNNLNVAIYGLRQTFRGTRPDFSHMLLQEDQYILNPAMRVWVDIEELARHYEVGRSLERQGKLSAAVREYAAAERLYQGDFYKSGSCKSGCIFGDECFVSHSGAIGRALHHRRREPHP